MGIPGLLPLLKPITREKHIKEYSGMRAAVDGLCWLHRAINSAEEVDMTKYINVCMFLINLLLSNDIRPVVVFDGMSLPAKSATNEKRRMMREQCVLKMIEAERNGFYSDADRYRRQSMVVGDEAVQAFISALQSANIDFIVAPYEADAQLAFLSLRNLVDVVITEDSDCLVYGCRRILFKMDSTGRGQEICRKDLADNKSPDFAGWSDEQFKLFCCLAGCDYVTRVPGIGIKTAHKIASGCPSFDQAARYLGTHKPSHCDTTYFRGLARAVLTFHHQIVYNPDTCSMEHLLPLTAKRSQALLQALVAFDSQPMHGGEDEAEAEEMIYGYNSIASLNTTGGRSVGSGSAGGGGRDGTGVVSGKASRTSSSNTSSNNNHHDALLASVDLSFLGYLFPSAEAQALAAGRALGSTSSATTDTATCADTYASAYAKATSAASVSASAASSNFQDGEGGEASMPEPELPHDNSNSSSSGGGDGGVVYVGASIDHQKLEETDFAPATATAIRERLPFTQRSDGSHALIGSMSTQLPPPPPPLQTQQQQQQLYEEEDQEEDVMSCLLPTSSFLLPFIPPHQSTSTSALQLQLPVSTYAMINANSASIGAAAFNTNKGEGGASTTTTAINNGGTTSGTKAKTKLTRNHAIDPIAFLRRNPLVNSSTGTSANSSSGDNSSSGGMDRYSTIKLLRPRVFDDADVAVPPRKHRRTLLSEATSTITGACNIHQYSSSGSSGTIDNSVVVNDENVDSQESLGRYGCNNNDNDVDGVYSNSNSSSNSCSNSYSNSGGICDDWLDESRAFNPVAINTAIKTISKSSNSNSSNVVSSNRTFDSSALRRRIEDEVRHNDEVRHKEEVRHHDEVRRKDEVRHNDEEDDEGLVAPTPFHRVIYTAKPYPVAIANHSRDSSSSNSSGNVIHTSSRTIKGTSTSTGIGRSNSLLLSAGLNHLLAGSHCSNNSVNSTNNSTNSSSNSNTSYGTPYSYHQPLLPVVPVPTSSTISTTGDTTTTNNANANAISDTKSKAYTTTTITTTKLVHAEDFLLPLDESSEPPTVIPYIIASSSSSSAISHGHSRGGGGGTTTSSSSTINNSTSNHRGIWDDISRPF